ncbi:hypothetical protein LT493_44835 [Streptomyces tricolor]|nr:hypothetical protein [Streptomyces tricolor]
MNVEELVREALREQADAQPPVPAGFADRVLGVRRRRRTRRLLSVAAATAAVVAVAVGVPLLHPGGNEVRPAAVPAPAGIRSHPDQSPPRELIAAGRTAMAAYYTRRTVPQGGDRGVTHRTYWLLNPETGRYEKDARWSFVAVAPGLRTAAVLERTLPAARMDCSTSRRGGRAVDPGVPRRRGARLLGRRPPAGRHGLQRQPRPGRQGRRRGEHRPHRLGAVVAGQGPHRLPRRGRLLRQGDLERGAARPPTTSAAWTSPSAAPATWCTPRRSAGGTACSSSTTSPDGRPPRPRTSATCGRTCRPGSPRTGGSAPGDWSRSRTACRTPRSAIR